MTDATQIEALMTVLQTIVDDHPRPALVLSRVDELIAEMYSGKRVLRMGCKPIGSRESGANCLSNRISIAAITRQAPRGSCRGAPNPAKPLPLRRERVARSNPSPRSAVTPYGPSVHNE